MSRSDPGVTRLHSRHHLALDGTPAMTPRFEQFINRRRVATAGDAPDRPPTLPPLSFAEAWARLHAQEPRLAQAVTVTVIQCCTVYAAAPVLGVSPSTTGRRKQAGLAALSIWTGLPVLEVVRRVGLLCALTLL